MEQKVVQIGNSIGVVIPQPLRGNLKSGDKVVISKKDEEFIISPIAEQKVAGVDSKFMRMVDEFITEHKDVLDELAKR